MKRLLLLASLVLASPLSAQENPRIAELTQVFRLALRLDMPVDVRQPTVVVLVAIAGPSGTLDYLREGQQVGDSILAALAPAAVGRGYVVEVRATSHQGLVDASNSVTYRAAPSRGPGILLIAPGRRPSRILPFPSPEGLDQAITAYEQSLRPLQPS